MSNPVHVFFFCGCIMLLKLLWHFLLLKFVHKLELTAKMYNHNVS